MIDKPITEKEWLRIWIKKVHYVIPQKYQDIMIQIIKDKDKEKLSAVRLLKKKIKEETHYNIGYDGYSIMKFIDECFPLSGDSDLKESEQLKVKDNKKKKPSKVKVYCNNPSCFAHYIANHKLGKDKVKKK